MGCCFSEPVDFDGEVNLYHFDLHRAVGRGAFGKVRVVEHKKSKKLYALKYIEKAQCIRQRAVANVVQERRLLEEIDHTFVVNMRYAFQDDENCFFVLDLMLGGDLRFHLERKGRIAEDVVAFWVAELSCGLEYLHRQRIIHRDLKPDNILLDSQGHAHLTDFNVAIHYSERRLHTSIAGSMAYMAPQVVGKKGYSWEIDWWSLGITAYELLFHRRPFDGRNADRMTHSIVKDPLKFPEDSSLSPAGIQALKGFIERDVSKRLGCRPGQGMDDIRRHPWFSTIDWDALENKELTPPFAPDMKHANFDVSHELDEFLMVEKPLTHTKRKANSDLDKLKPELRQLEEQFSVYDYTRSQRVSYYPHNQPVTTIATVDTDRTLAPTRSRTGSDVIAPTATIAERSRGGTPTPPPPVPVPIPRSPTSPTSPTNPTSPTTVVVAS
ncbi:kinase-like protein [Hymenopellis radicata]|nr:kinase-like protein [Hymenopellis radicata]